MSSGVRECPGGREGEDETTGREPVETVCEIDRVSAAHENEGRQRNEPHSERNCDIRQWQYKVEIARLLTMNPVHGQDDRHGDRNLGGQFDSGTQTGATAKFRPIVGHAKGGQRNEKSDAQEQKWIVQIAEEKNAAGDGEHDEQTTHGWSGLLVPMEFLQHGRSRFDRLLKASLQPANEVRPQRKCEDERDDGRQGGAKRDLLERRTLRRKPTGIGELLEDQSKHGQLGLCSAALGSLLMRSRAKRVAAECRGGVVQLPRVSLSNRSDLAVTPALSLEFHREAIFIAIDPVTAIPEDPLLQPRREGSASGPATIHANDGTPFGLVSVPLCCVDFVSAENMLGGDARSGLWRRIREGVEDLLHAHRA